jgi:hypothetical protein
LAQISRNLGNSPAVIEQGTRQQQRVAKRYDNVVEPRRQSQRVVEEKEVSVQGRGAAARFEADLMAKQLFEMKVRDSLTAERLEPKVTTEEMSIGEIEPKEIQTPSMRLDKQIEELMAIQSDMPVRNEPLFVNVTV